MAYVDGVFRHCNLTIEGGVIAGIDFLPDSDNVNGDNGTIVFPGFTDVHVHLREPGFSYKETIRTGTRAAAHGGCTTVCAMPNLSPAPDCREHLERELDAIRRDACIRVIPYGTITMAQQGRTLSDMENMAADVAGFSDDGRGVQNEDVMRAAMTKARELHKIIAAHCEDDALLFGGYIHDGAYAAAHGHRGISSMSEWRPIRRDLELVRQTGCSYHVCHISTKESVELIRQAKRDGLDVTCETAPHYLLLDENDLQEDGRFKMNPPLRAKEDREALLEGLMDGTIDMIATDHAPHSAEEKSRGLKDSAMGIVGIETAFPLLYTGLVRRGTLSLSRLVELMSVRPAARFDLESGIRVGARADLCIWNLNETWMIDPNEFLSMGRATPFAGWQVFGRCLETICQGESVYRKGEAK